MAVDPWHIGIQMERKYMYDDVKLKIAIILVSMVYTNICQRFGLDTTARESILIQTGLLTQSPVWTSELSRGIPEYLQNYNIPHFRFSSWPC